MHGMRVELRFRKDLEQRCLAHLRQPDDSSLHNNLRFADWVICRFMKRPLVPSQVGQGKACRRVPPAAKLALRDTELARCRGDDLREPGHLHSPAVAVIPARTGLATTYRESSKVTLLLDEVGLESPLENMTDPPVAPTYAERERGSAPHAAGGRRPLDPLYVPKRRVSTEKGATPDRSRRFHYSRTSLD